MANPSEQISIGRALARLAVARAFRQTCTIKHASVTSPALACRIIEQNNDDIDQAPGINNELRMIQIRVTANQTGFQYVGNDTELVVDGDQVTLSKYSGRIYSVKGPIGLDVGARVYKLTLQEDKRLSSGGA